MTLPNWEQNEATRLVARDLAGVAVVESRAGRDVIMAQYFGRLGYVVLLDELAHEHGVTFIEVILAVDAELAIDRFRARRRAMIERGERHPERDIADPDVEAFIGDSVNRLARLATARPGSRIVPIALAASEDALLMWGTGLGWASLARPVGGGGQQVVSSNSRQGVLLAR